MLTRRRAKRTERSGSLPRFEIPGDFPFCKYCFCFLVLAWTLLTLFASLYALPVHVPRQVYVGGAPGSTFPTLFALETASSWLRFSICFWIDF